MNWTRCGRALEPNSSCDPSRSYWLDEWKEMDLGYKKILNLTPAMKVVETVMRIKKWLVFFLMKSNPLENLKQTKWTSMLI